MSDAAVRALLPVILSPSGDIEEMMIDRVNLVTLIRLIHTLDKLNLTDSVM